MVGSRFLVLALLLLGLVVIVAAIGWVVARRPLQRSTVERFARRQRLGLVDANAAYVVGALVITHRWRRAGLVLGLLVGMGWSLQRGSLTLHFLAGFLGWFVGAVIAEWRISRLDQPGTRRVAGLETRNLGRYLTLPVLAVAGVIALLVVAAASAALARAGLSWQWAAWMLYAVAVLTGLALTARAVVNRPSGFVDGAVRDADDALRCHGLTVLVGSGVAAAYPVISAFAVAAAHPDGAPYSMDPAWTVLVMAALIITGLWIAVWSPSARASRVPDPHLHNAAEPEGTAASA